MNEMINEITKSELFNQIHQHLLINEFVENSGRYSRRIFVQAGPQMIINGQVMNPQSKKLEHIFEYWGTGEITDTDGGRPQLCETYHIGIYLEKDPQFELAIGVHCLEEFVELFNQIV